MSRRLCLFPIRCSFGANIVWAVEPTRGRSDHRSINPAHVASSVMFGALARSHRIEVPLELKLKRYVRERTYVRQFLNIVREDISKKGTRHAKGTSIK